MAFNQVLAARVRALIQAEPGFTERKMFGGIGFMLQGNMACGVIGDDLIVRTGPEGYEDALANAHSKAFNMTGRTMKGWVMVGLSGLGTEQDLREWTELALAFVKSLPPK